MVRMIEWLLNMPIGDAISVLISILTVCAVIAGICEALLRL
jgi:hypothetical protein